jgi:hypothetical protein
VGWILTISKIGEIFDIQGFHVWNLVMTVIMCATWVVLFILTVIAFWEGKIFNSTPEDVLRDMYDIEKMIQVRDIERRLSVVERSVNCIA